MPVSSSALDHIKNLLGQAGFVDGEAMVPYLTSWRGAWTGNSPLIAMPNSTEQTSSLVKICHEHRMGMVPQGGNTGLVGGSTPSQEGDQIIINMSRMNKIRAIDAAGLNITTEVGVILKNLQDFATDAGMFFPLSMASEGSAEIGGALSTNAGGTAVLRYGSMRDLVLGIEAVLPNGDIYSGLKTLIKDNAGYNLGRLLVGAEGTLGIMTAATLKLFPQLHQKITAVVAVETTEKALALLHRFQSQASEYLTAFEVMSREALWLVTQKIAGARFPGRDDAQYYVLLEMGVTSPTLPLRSVMEECAAAALESGLIVDAVMAESDAQARQFWHLREHIPEAVRKTGNSIHFDISLPTAAWADFMVDMGRRIRTLAPDILLVPFGHLGDGNLHYNMCFEKAPDHFADIKKQIKEMVYADIIERKGSISAEHGIGLERKAELKQAREPHELDLMKRIKLAFDPHNLMNPGKIFD